MYLKYVYFARVRKNLLSTYLCNAHSPYTCGTNCLCGSSSTPFHFQIGPILYKGVFNMGKGIRSKLKSLKNILAKCVYGLYIKRNNRVFVNKSRHVESMAKELAYITIVRSQPSIRKVLLSYKY